MGVTISHKIGIAGRSTVKVILDKAETVARCYAQDAKKLSVSFEIRRESETCLLVDIGNCETLAFDFKSVAELVADKESVLYRYNSGQRKTETQLFEDGYKHAFKPGYKVEDYPQNEMFYTNEFCKTQFCKDLWEHKTVANLIRVVASYARYAEVNDEGDYYHTGEIEDANKAIAENGALINSIGTQLQNSGWDASNIIKGTN